MAGPGSPRGKGVGGGGGGQHARTPSLVNLNNNSNWLASPGVWATYVAATLLLWLALVGPLGGSPAHAWDATVLAHFALTFPLLHWVKGSPVGADQGAYDALTFWEQMDGGLQLTRTKKFFTAVPLAMALPCCSPGAGAAGWAGRPLAPLALAATAVLVVAKAPWMHKVRIFGINAGVH